MKYAIELLDSYWSLEVYPEGPSRLWTATSPTQICYLAESGWRTEPPFSTHWEVTDLDIDGPNTFFFQIQKVEGRFYVIRKYYGESLREQWESVADNLPDAADYCVRKLGTPLRMFPDDWPDD